MSNNFQDITCFFCGKKNTVGTGELCVACASPLSVHGKLVGAAIGSYELVEYKARGFYGLTFRARDKLGGKDVALKLISKAAYEKHDKDFAAEVALYGQLPSVPTIADYIIAGEQSVAVDGTQVEVYYIVCKWIAGPNLRDFLKCGEAVPEDLIAAARDLLSGLRTLYDHNLWHNDLHDENILVQPLTEAELATYGRSVKHLFVIVDVGSMVHRNPAAAKQLGDATNVGAHLSALQSSIVEHVSDLSKEDQFFLSIIDEALARLMDETPGRAYASPTEALNRINELYNSSRLGEPEQLKKLETPYAYINANDIPSPWLLRHMFSDKFRYFKDVTEGSSQCLLVTGPRGCGKTMLLKNMRFSTLFDASGDEKQGILNSLPYVGLFVSARTNFGNYLVSYRPQEWVQSEAKVMLYFNLLVSTELVDVLYRLSMSGLVSDSSVRAVLDVISERHEMPHLTLLTAKDRLVRRAKDIVNGKDVQTPTACSTPSYLNDILRIFASAMPALRGKPVILLIDDLTLPRVPLDVQRALIPAIFNTGADYRIRVTAHSDGLVLRDIAGEEYKENRDYQHVNLGYEYWQLSDNYEGCRDGVDDILRKRFYLASRGMYPGLETMLGRGDKLQAIGQEIHRRAATKTLGSLRYAGAKVVVKLCSGDVSYLLDMLGKMERIAGTEQYPIRQYVQNQVIKSYARNELRSLQDIRPTQVSSLYDIAYYFGVWSKSKLIQHNDEYLRIEVEQNRLSEEARLTMRELLCHGVFIDGGWSNMSDGHIARRLLFRRIYTPAFPTTFNNRCTFAMRNRNFVKFITNPKDFVRERMSGDGIAPDEQQVMEQLEFSADKGNGF